MDDDDFKCENLLEGVPREATLDGGVQSKRFTDPVSEKDVLEKIKSTVPQSTKQSTVWAANIWQDWLEYLQTKGEELPHSLA